jgi:hypothetical protein
VPVPLSQIVKPGGQMLRVNDTAIASNSATLFPAA